MPITFDCPCGKTLRVPDASAGKKAKCPLCGAVVSIPEPEPVFEIVEPPLPPEPVAAPLPPPVPYGKSKIDEDEEDKTPYGLAEPEKRGSELDRDGQPRHRGAGLPNFNKGRKNYGN